VRVAPLLRGHGHPGCGAACLLRRAGVDRLPRGSERDDDRLRRRPAPPAGSARRALRPVGRPAARTGCRRPFHLDGAGHGLAALPPGGFRIPALLRGAGPAGAGGVWGAAPSVPADGGRGEHLSPAPGARRGARVRLVLLLPEPGALERLPGRAGTLAGVERRGPPPAAAAGPSDAAAPPRAHRTLPLPLR